MNHQLDIFEAIAEVTRPPFSEIHHQENNVSNQAFYDDNRPKFNKQCEQVYNLLKSGVRLTVVDAIINYKIHSLPRRILDLKSLGVDIKTHRLESGCVEYYMDLAA